MWKVWRKLVTTYNITNNSTTVQQYNSTTLQQYNSTTVQHYNIKTLKQYNITNNSTTVQQYNRTTVQQYNITALHYYESRRSASTSSPPYLSAFFDSPSIMQNSLQSFYLDNSYN